MSEGGVKYQNIHRLASSELVLNSKPYRGIETHDCGTAALCLITGISPDYINSLSRCRGKKSWYFDDMVEFLRKRKFDVVELTKKSVTNVPWTFEPVTRNHCLLMFLKMDKKEYSAFVMHKGVGYHNMHRQKIDGLFLMNKPTEHVFIVSHK